MTRTIDFVADALGIAAGLVFAALLVVLLVRYFGEALCPAWPGLDFFSLPRRRQARPKFSVGQAILLSGIAFLVSRLFFVALAAVAAWWNGELTAYLCNLPVRWRRWDAYHYVGLMENWYVNEGDPRYHIVFFPLYPLLGRALYLLGIPSLAAAYLVSCGCLIGAGVALYFLLQIDQGHSAAIRAVWLMMLCPVSFFFSAPFTESTFLFTTLMAVLLARKKRFFWAVVFGALSANCRSLGMATAIPIFWEMLRDMRQRHSIRREIALGTVLCVAKVLPVSLGLAAYLALNQQITGSAWTFLTYQSQHWGQEFGSAMNTISYTLKNAVSYADVHYRMGVWTPQIVSIALVMALLVATWRRLHPGDAAYALVYFYCAIAPTWLLSGARYLGAMYALYPMLTLITRKKWQFMLVLTIEIILGAYMSILYVITGAVM